MKSITINGKKYPVRFSTRALIDFEKRTGITIASLEDPNKRSLTSMIELAYSGLKDGARKNKKKLLKDENIEWFLDSIDEDEKILESVLEIFTTSQEKK